MSRQDISIEENLSPLGYTVDIMQTFLDSLSWNKLRSHQAASNRSSQDQWEGFAGHRDRVSALLGAGGSGGSTRLCVLGAGNANDLDLPALLKAHREIHLVDLDSEALARGVERQGLTDHPGLHCQGGIDVTAMFDNIATWTPGQPIEPEALAALADWPSDRVGIALPGPFDLVASTCLLTQLIHSVYQVIGENQSSFKVVVRALRVGHLRLLARLTAPGGAATLITDVVSSDIFPPLTAWPDAELAGLLPRLAVDRNHIQGVHPSALLAALRDDPVLKAQVSGLETFQPWRWKLHAREFLVWGIRYRLHHLKF